MALSFALETMSRSTFMNPGGAFDFMANVCSDQPNPAKTFGFFLKVPFLRIGGNSDLRGCPPGRRPTSYATAFGGGCLQTLSVGRGFGWAPNLFFTPGSHGGGEFSKARGTSTSRIIPESCQLVSESDVSGRHVEQVDIQSLKFPEHPLHNGPAFAKLLLLLLQPARPYVIRKL